MMWACIQHCGYLATRFPIAMAASLVLASVLVAVTCAYLYGYFWEGLSGYLPERALAFVFPAAVVAGLLMYLYTIGIFDSGSTLVTVQARRIKLTVPEDTLDELQKSCMATLKMLNGDYFDKLVQINKKFSNDGTHRGQFTRAVPVIADPLKEGRYWTLDNERVVRYSLSGHSHITVRLVSLETLSADLSADLAHWQMLRARAARVTNVELIKRLRAVEIAFLYAGNEYDCRHSRLQIFFLRPASTRRSKLVQPEKVIRCTIEELENEFQPLIEKAEAQMAVASSAKLQAKKRFGDDSHIAASLTKGSEMEAETAVGDEGNAGLCVVCLENRADFVVRTCGHLVFCAGCHRHVVALARGVARPKDITFRQLSRTGVTCPMCRSVSFTVRQRSFMGTMYKQ